jgi:hypothetical protein
MNIHSQPTIIPGAYPALESERYRAVESAHERQTEPPPGPPTVIWDTPRATRPALIPLPWGAR